MAFMHAIAKSLRARYILKDKGYDQVLRSIVFWLRRSLLAEVMFRFGLNGSQLVERWATRASR